MHQDLMRCQRVPRWGVCGLPKPAVRGEPRQTRVLQGSRHCMCLELQRQSRETPCQARSLPRETSAVLLPHQKPRGLLRVC